MYCELPQKRTSGIEGRVNVNGIERELKAFRKRSAYIMQKDNLLPNLTLDEYMTAAAHLKLGNRVSNQEKQSTVSFTLTNDFRWL